MRFIPHAQPPAQPTPQAWCFAFVQRDLLLAEGPALADALQPQAPAGWVDAAPVRHYLGTLAGHDAWALALPEVPAGWRATPLRAALMALDGPLAAVAGRAAQLLEWDRSHRFCGVCGTATRLQPGERARVCPACGHSAYPRLSPSMMALVWRPGQLLLARSSHFRPGMYSALAGFVEAGESLEDCVHREVAEEVGLQVQGLRYYGSQSWPFPHSLMVAYTARYAAGAVVPQPGEIEDAQWFDLDALPEIPPRFFIAGHLIRDTLAALREGRLADDLPAAG